MTRRLMALVAAAILAVAVSSTADARPRHRHHAVHKHHAHHHVHRHKHRAVRVVSAPAFFPTSSVVSKARAYLGMTASQVGVRTRLWCSAFMRKVTGTAGVDDRARSWLSRPRVVPSVGAVVVLRRGHHVGVVSGFTANGDPVVISGNHGNRVAEAVYSRRQVVAYVSAQ